MALENEALIQIADVYRIYDSSGTDIPVLKGISLSVYPEDKLVIVGPSGSGKTTLMSIMTGFNRPSAGQVYWSVADREINKLSQNQITKYRRNFIGFINQETQLFPQLTIKENILISAKLSGMKSADYLDQYQRLVSLLNIEELVSRKKSHHTSRRSEEHTSELQSH